jgi:hypothetical protein
MVELTSKALVSRNQDLIAASIDNDLVMMSVDQGEYYGITGVGSQVWEMLAEPISVEDITRHLCAEYDVDKNLCQADMQSFVDDLLKLGLVSIVE